MFRIPSCRSFMALAAIVAAVASSQALAQSQAVAPTATTTPPPGFASKQVLVSPISGVDHKQVVLVSVSLAPGVTSPAHMHPGDCFGSVIEGAIELRVQGMEPRRIEAGQSYSTMNGVAHEFSNVGDKPARLLNTLVVDKGRPATTPASSPAR